MSESRRAQVLQFSDPSAYTAQAGPGSSTSAGGGPGPGSPAASQTAGDISDATGTGPGPGANAAVQASPGYSTSDPEASTAQAGPGSSTGDPSAYSAQAGPGSSTSDPSANTAQPGPGSSSPAGGDLVLDPRHRAKPQGTLLPQPELAPVPAPTPQSKRALGIRPVIRAPIRRNRGPARRPVIRAPIRRNRGPARRPRRVGDRIPEHPLRAKPELTSRARRIRGPVRVLAPESKRVRTFRLVIRTRISPKRARAQVGRSPPTRAPVRLPRLVPARVSTLLLPTWVRRPPGLERVLAAPAQDRVTPILTRELLPVLVQPNYNKFS